MFKRIATVLLGIMLGIGSAQAGGFFNGSFETGDYTGWNLQEYSLYDYEYDAREWGTWGIARNGQTVNNYDYLYDFNDKMNVYQNSPGLPRTYTATQGDYLAVQLQNGPQMHRMSQDLTISDKTLSFDMAYDNHAGMFDPTYQNIMVTLRDPTDDHVIATLFDLASTQALQAQDMTRYCFDLSEYIGRKVRFDVEMSVNNYFFDAAFDNFQCGPAGSVPEPMTLGLLAVGSAGLLIRRRRTTVAQ